MATNTIQVNIPNPTINMAGATTVNATMSWTPPSFPEGVSSWDGAVITGTWAWNGKGSVTSITFGGTLTTTNGIGFTYNLTPTEIQNGQVALKATGGNKNVTGTNFTWTGLIAIYTYTEPIVPPKSYYHTGGEYVEAVFYDKVDGQWIMRESAAEILPTYFLTEVPIIGSDDNYYIDNLGNIYTDVNDTMFIVDTNPIGVNQFSRTEAGYVPGHFVGADGNVNGWGPGAVSNYMRVRSDCVYRVQGAAALWDKLSYYDECYKFIEATHSLLYTEPDFQIGLGTKYPIPKNAVYVRVNATVANELYFERIQ